MCLNLKDSIDAMHNLLYLKIAKVELVKLSDEDIAKYTSNIQINEYKQTTKKRKYETHEKNILKSNLPEEGKICESKSQFKVTINDNEENERKKFKNNDQDNFVGNKSTISSVDKTETLCGEPLKVTECTNSRKIGTIRCCDVNKLIEDKEENEKKKFKSNDQDNILDNTSTISSVEKTENLCDESLKAIKSITSPKAGTIWCCDMNKLIEASKLEKYFEHFGLLLKNPKFSRNNENKPKVIIPINQTTQHSLQKGKTFICVIEFLYQKYFNSNLAQNNIVIMANILNIIRISDEHHKAQMGFSFYIKKHTSQKSERSSYSIANALHLRNLNVLKSKFQRYLLGFLSNVIKSDYELAFKMFFLSIFTILNVKHQSKSNESIFKNLTHLLWNCLKDNELEHGKTITILKSENFHSDCINLIRVIEDSRSSDPNNNDRLSIFFTSSVNSQEHVFQNIINTVTSGNSNVDLASLIDIAALQCFNNSKFKSSMNITSQLSIKKNGNITITTSDQNSTKTDDFTQLCTSCNAVTLSTTVQPLSEHDFKSNQNTSIAQELGRASRNLFDYYTNFSRTISNINNSPSISQFTLPKRTDVTLSSNVFNDSSLLRPTNVTSRPTNQGSSISATTIPRPTGVIARTGDKSLNPIPNLVKISQPQPRIV